MYYITYVVYFICTIAHIVCCNFTTTKIEKKVKSKHFFKNISRYSSAMPRTSTSTSPERSQLATRGSYLRDTTNHSTRLDEAVTPMNNPAGTRDRRADRSNYRYWYVRLERRVCYVHSIKITCISNLLSLILWIEVDQILIRFLRIWYLISEFT